MLKLGLGSADMNHLISFLKTTHDYDVNVWLETLDGTTITDSLDGLVVDGQVDVALGDDGNPTRTMSLKVQDPNNQLAIRNNGVWLQRRVAADLVVMVPELGVVSIPLGRCPITACLPTGSVLDITGGDMLQTLADQSLLAPYVLPFSTTIYDAIQKTLGALAGFPQSWLQRVPHVRKVLGASIVSDDSSTPYSLASQAAAVGGYMLQSTADGNVLMRKPQTSPHFEFDDGDGGSVTSMPTVTNDSTGLYNVVEIMPAGGGGTPLITLYADPNNPLSGESLAITPGTTPPRYRVKQIDLPAGHSPLNVKAYAQQQLDLILGNVISFNFDSLLIPLFEAGDCVSVQTTNFATKFTLQQFTLPLLSSTQMSVGVTDLRSHTGRLRTYQRHE